MSDTQRLLSENTIFFERGSKALHKLRLYLLKRPERDEVLCKRSALQRDQLGSIIYLFRFVPELFLYGHTNNVAGSCHFSAVLLYACSGAAQHSNGTDGVRYRSLSLGARRLRLNFVCQQKTGHLLTTPSGFYCHSPAPTRPPSPTSTPAGFCCWWSPSETCAACENPSDPTGCGGSGCAQ